MGDAPAAARPSLRWPVPVQVASWLLAGAAVGYLAWAIGRHWGAIATSSWEVSAGLLTLSVVVMAADLLIVPFVWRETLLETGFSLPWRRAMVLWMASAIGRYLPGRLWGLLGQIYWGRADALDPGTVWRSNLRLAVYAIGGHLVAGGVLLFPLAAPSVPHFRLMLALGALAGLLLMAGSPWEWLAARLGIGWLRRDGPSRRGRVAALLALHWGVFLIAVFVALAAVRPGAGGGGAGRDVADRAAGVLAVSGAFAGAQIVAVAALIMPAGLGVREGALAAMLGLWLAPPAALAYSLGSRLWLTAAEALAIGLVLGVAGAGRWVASASRIDPAADATWERRARLGGLRAVLDPADRFGGRNLLIHELQVRALAPHLGRERAGRALDVGTGNGRILALWRASGVDAVGVDRSLALLREARSLGMPLVCADVRALPFRAGAFDAVSCVGVLAPLAAAARPPGAGADLGRELARVTGPAGRLICIEKVVPGGGPLAGPGFRPEGWSGEVRRTVRGGRSWCDRLALVVGRSRRARGILVRGAERAARRLDAAAAGESRGRRGHAPYHEVLFVMRRTGGSPR